MKVEKNEIKKFGTLKISMPISYSICAEIQKKRNIWKTKKRYWADIEKIV